MTAPTFVSLYSGAGGLDKGFVDAGFEPLWANDFDPDACATYRAHIGGHIACGDLAGVRPQLDFLEPDLVIGGPPCQGFSVAGHMRRDDPRSRHVWNFFDVVADVRPRAFVMENVKNLAINRRWSELMVALRDRASSLGYATQVWLLNASHFGVPQARERMFLVGVAEGVLQGPEPTTADAPPSVGEALARLPRIGQPGNDAVCPARVTPARNPVLRKSPYAGMLFNGKGRPLDLAAPASTLPATMGGNRTPILDQAQLDGDAECHWVVGYHRHLMEGGDPVKRVPARLRRLSVNEAAVLQTFPREWAFAGTQSAQFRQIGNAVPPVLARVVAERVSVSLGGSASMPMALAA